MRSAIVGLGLLAASMGSASAARVSWEGDVMVTGVTSACSGSVAVGDRYFSGFEPSGLGGNGTDSSLSFVTARSATSFRFVNHRAGANTAYTGVIIGSRGGFVTGLSGKTVTFTTSPAINATAPFLNVNAKITNFEDTPGCTATIQGAYVLRRDPPG